MTTAADTETADLLRRAAALIRQRANDATPGKWEVIDDGIYVAPRQTDEGWLFSHVIVIEAEVREPELPPSDLTHIASWDPTVALAVAAWLDNVAMRCPSPDAYDWPHSEDRDAALTIARAYLREDQP